MMIPQCVLDNMGEHKKDFAPIEIYIGYKEFHHVANRPILLRDTDRLICDTALAIEMERAGREFGNVLYDRCTWHFLNALYQQIRDRLDSATS